MEVEDTLSLTPGRTLVTLATGTWLQVAVSAASWSLVLLAWTGGDDCAADCRSSSSSSDHIWVCCPRRPLRENQGAVSSREGPGHSLVLVTRGRHSEAGQFMQK